VVRTRRLTAVASPKKTFQYFAYGSNMLTRRLTAAERAPSAVLVGIGYIEERRLTFNKVSQDGSGKCDAQRTHRKSDRVYGVIYNIAQTDKTALAKAEGLGKGYVEDYVEVITSSGGAKVLTYLATKREPALLPYHWYKAIVIAGAVEHELPTDYVEWLRAFESLEDPNGERRAKNEALLFAC
jgi:gamma-glutamylcyclotransferase